MLRSGGLLRPRALAVLVALVLTTAAGCSSGDDAPSADRAEFGRTMEERYGIDREQAACITEYVFDDYDDAEIVVLTDDGMPALPQARWEPYLNATVTCITHDEPLDGAP